jgi:hypothetical protein
MPWGLQTLREPQMSQELQIPQEPHTLLKSLRTKISVGKFGAAGRRQLFGCLPKESSPGGNLRSRGKESGGEQDIFFLLKMAESCSAVRRLLDVHVPNYAFRIKIGKKLNVSRCGE